MIISVRESIPSKVLKKHKLPQVAEGMLVDLNYRKKNACFSEPIIPALKMSSTILKHLIKPYIVIGAMKRLF